MLRKPPPLSSNRLLRLLLLVQQPVGLVQLRFTHIILLNWQLQVCVRVSVVHHFQLSVFRSALNFWSKNRRADSCMQETGVESTRHEHGKAYESGEKLIW